MIRGNLALRDHIKNGKRVFFFKSVKKAFVEYITELEFLEFDIFNSNGTDGKERVAIKFLFKRAGVQLDYNPEKINDFILANPLTINMPNETERKGLVTSRIGQGAYRKGVLHRWMFKCAVTGCAKHNILIASDILLWKDATNDDRLNIHNGILLTPNYDALFDKHLISFDDNGQILLSKQVLNSDYKKLGIVGSERIQDISLENKPFLKLHREQCLELM